MSIKWVMAVATVLLCHCTSAVLQPSRGRVDGYSQIVKTLSWLNARVVADATERDVRGVLGSVEAQHVTRLPVQIYREWSDNLLWNDATGRYQIIFARVHHANAPFSRFQFSGRFDTRVSGADAIAAWLAIIDPAAVHERVMELEASTESLVEYEIRKNGRAIRVFASVYPHCDTWTAGLQIDAITGPSTPSRSIQR